jgi:predicted Zn-dependent protease with MMP-like domain
MREGRSRRAAGRSAVTALAAALCAPAAFSAPAGAREAADRTPARVLVTGAAARAAAKLRRPECREVLSDFRDTAGRRLSEVVEERGLGVEEFFASLVFVDGRPTPLCQRGNVAAGANPGTVFVGVCKETFARVQAEDPGLAANVLIHEMLHALGLGEDDPATSEEITRQVGKRCGH